jgi:hydroxyacylglutathione hydrolase
MGLYRKLNNDFYVIYTGPEPVKDHINTYLLLSSKRKALIIDPGPRNSAERIYGVLRELGLEKALEFIIVTHVHLDHAGAATKLSKLTGAAIVVHPKGVPHIRDPTNIWEAARRLQGEVAEIYGRPDNGEDVEILEAQDLQNLSLDDIELRFLHTPGHASHHIVINWLSRSMLFTGDAAGTYIPELDVILPGTPPPFRYEPYMESLKKMIEESPKIIAYAHRGVRSNGVEALVLHYRQMETWFKTLVPLDEKSLSDEEALLRRIAEKDHFLKLFLEKCSGIDCLSYKAILTLSIMGIIDEVKRVKALQ